MQDNLKWMLRANAALLLLGCLVTACTSSASLTASRAANSTPDKPYERIPYIVGADISWVQQREAAGTRYSDNGTPKDILEILKSHGFNYIRLRVFNDPTKATPRDRPYSPQGFCDLPHTIAMAKRVKAAGMGFLIDFHYSDAWADPQKQYSPSAWANIPAEELPKAIRQWTRSAVQQMTDAGVQPDMVQIGNEITPGMMMDKGGTVNNWPVLASFLKAGIAGVRDVSPQIIVMLHLDRGGDLTFDGTLGGANRTTHAWIDNALAQSVEFDILGLSCYQRWQGPPAGWKANFADLAAHYPKLKFVIAECDAQALDTNDVMKSLPENRGLGTFIWEPEANNANQQLFDTRGAVIPARMEAYDQVVGKYGLKKIP
jgi:arabinogalactan endo-1,4-beta-galactosidase